MSRTMPRFGLAVGCVSFVLTVADTALWIPIPLLGALVAFVHGAWRFAALTAGLCLCLAITGTPSVASLPDLFAKPVLLAPFVLLLGLGTWLAFDYRRSRGSIDVPRYPAWVCDIRDRAGVVVGVNSVVIAFGAVMYIPLLPILGPGWWWEPYARSVDTLFPVATVGTLAAFACGAWRTATLGSYVFVHARLMFDESVFLIVGAMLAVVLIWSYRRSASRAAEPV